MVVTIQNIVYNILATNNNDDDGTRKSLGSCVLTHFFGCRVPPSANLAAPGFAHKDKISYPVL